MNQLKTTDNGGFPFELDDLRFMINGIKEAFKGVISGIGGYDNLATGKLSGCVDNASTTVSSGFVAIDGEVLYYPGGPWPALTPGPGKVLHFTVDSTFDSAGLETFENGTSHDTWEIRRAKLVYEVPVGPYVPHDDLTPVYLGQNSGITGAVLVNSWADQVGEVASYSKTSTGLIIFKGAAFAPIANKNDTIFNLPAAFRPGVTVRVPVTVIQLSTLTLANQVLIVGSNGDVKLDSTYTGVLSGTDIKVILEGTTFKL